MESFARSGRDVSRVLRAVVLGGNALAARQGARKRRHSVPGKQERLVRLLAEHGEVGFEALCEAFPREWAQVAKRRAGQAKLLAKREFFRNMADLVARVNEALLAGYEDAGNEVRELTGGLLGFTFDYPTFTVSWREVESVENVASLPRTTGSHAPLTPSRSHAPLPTTSSTTDQVAGSEPVVPLELVVEEDRVTGAWRFTIDGHRVEVEPRLGFVKVDGRVFPVAEVRGLSRMEDLAGEPLAAIRRLLSERRNH